MKTSQHHTDVVTDPVGQISISGVHGRAELERHVSSIRHSGADDEGSIGRIVAGALIGAAVMYLLDPDRGARRRSLVRDKLVRAGHTSADRLGKLGRDTRNRAAGAVAETRAHFRSDNADDVVLAERVRAEIGHVASNARAIDVSVCEGCVTLSGPVPIGESERILSAARSVRGVRDVKVRLEVHETADRASDLQGSA